MERGLYHPDFFEDGHHHWWIAARLVETGVYADPFANQVGGIWLPGYDFVAAGLLSLAGVHAMWSLRLASAVLSAGSTLIVYSLAERRTKGAGLFAAGLFAFYPYDGLTGAMALPESLTVFLTLLGLWLIARRGRTSAPGGGVALAAACVLRYEAWVVAGMAALDAWRKEGRRALLPFAIPAFVALAWIISTVLSPGGFFASRIYNQTHTELAYHIGVGFASADPVTRFAAFASLYVPPVAIVVGGVLAAPAPLRRDAVAAGAFGMSAAVAALILLGVTSGSSRYLSLAGPLLCVLAGTGLLVASRSFAARVSGSHVLTLAVVGVVANGGAGVADMIYADNFGRLMGPYERAGEWIAENPPPADKLVLSESPVAAFRSGVQPSRIVGSKILPDDREGAIAFLRTNASYVVYVDNPPQKFPFYKLNALFPELSAGNSTGEFELLYDANSWEREYGARGVYVFRAR